VELERYKKGQEGGLPLTAIGKRESYWSPGCKAPCDGILVSLDATESATRGVFIPKERLESVGYSENNFSILDVDWCFINLNVATMRFIIMAFGEKPYRLKRKLAEQLVFCLKTYGRVNSNKS
jgi:hypothetical protein